MSEDTRTAMEQLYREAVSLADSARGWFDGPGAEWRGQLPVDDQARVATESLATTSRLMAVMSWLLDPAHLGAGPLKPFVGEAGAGLPTGSPLAGSPGADIVLAAQQLAGRVAALAGDQAVAA